MKPAVKPQNPRFSSGPVTKHNGWSLQSLQNAVVGRSHRSPAGKAKLARVIDLSREILSIPSDYKIGIVPASDTGAFEMAMWNLLGARGVDMFAWESFGFGWVDDVQNHLKLQDVRAFTADYGKLPDLSQADWSRDICFTWNGTTSGVKVPNGDWIDDSRQGLSICDATSAVYAMDIPWHKIDVATWSWQKILGGEAAHGMIVLSPRAVERLESYSPEWPIPKILRLTKNNKLISGIFQGATINTPSMLCVEDAIIAHEWIKSIGGLSAMVARSQNNLQIISDWVQATDWIDFLAEDPNTCSNTSICLKLTDDWFVKLDNAAQSSFIKQITQSLEQENVAYDIASYRDAPAGLRIWGGGTVEADDISALLPWIEWAYLQLKP